MAYKPKSWSEKLASSKPPQVKRLDIDFADMHAGSRMLIASPAIIDAYVRKIPKGKTRTLPEMRQDLAHEYKADQTCPLTTGIFLRIVSEAAYEKYLSTGSLKNITPFWRVVDAGTSLAKKLGCGPEFIREQRQKESSA